MTDTDNRPSTGKTHAAWLPDEALASVGRRTVMVRGDGPLIATVKAEVDHAAGVHGGSSDADKPDAVLVTVLALRDELPSSARAAAAAALGVLKGSASHAESFALARADGVTVVVGATGHGVMHGWFHLLRLAEAAFTGDREPEFHTPQHSLRMLDHWDNVAVHDVMGQVERGYAGGSIFYDDGQLRADLSRVRAYARLLAATGVNHVSINNVNVHPTGAMLLTDRLDDVAKVAACFRPYGIRVHLSVSFASPMLLGGLNTSDPLDAAVARWWVDVAARVYGMVPDFGGFVVKADSEGQPGPFAYGRDHADGANVLAVALRPYGGVVHWRAFVYNHTQDWRDRSTDRARAAYDHFSPLDGRFDDNVIVQVKYGPMDFQAREPVSPVLAAMPRTRMALELQVTQEYTGHQLHACYLAPQWSEVLGFRPWGGGDATLADVVAGRAGDHTPEGLGGGFAAVSNVGSDPFWTGHPLAQANLYAYGRLVWDPTLDASGLLDEWISLTFPGADPRVRDTVHALLDNSWHTYEKYTAPLGVGFMVQPGLHYGPNVDGYEYTQWGTYHFADRDGIGVDRTRGTGTGYTGQYPLPWSETYEYTATCPDELLLFFHHVPYTHALHSGVSVIQHIYDTHFKGVEEVRQMVDAWQGLRGLVADDVFDRVAERLTEQLRSATEWRDHVNTYFLRKSGIPDVRGRRIY